VSEERSAAKGEDAAAVHALVYGRVQGVGFRFFVEDAATGLALRGYVRNRSDGRSVEVVAEGPRHRLESLLTELRQGPQLARVERVNVTWMAATGEYHGFDVR
jgi:acylphosphatase